MTMQRVRHTPLQTLALARGELAKVIAEYEKDPELVAVTNDLNVALDYITSSLTYLKYNPQLGR